MRSAPLDHLIQRPAIDADRDLIYQILHASLGPYVVQTFGQWDDAGQRKRFDQVTRTEDHAILELNGQPVGCLCLRQSETEIRLIRLFILPDFQNRGLGTHALTGILATADERGLPVRLRVLRVNPARRLYERHGFVVTDESEAHYTMIRAARCQSAIPMRP